MSVEEEDGLLELQVFSQVIYWMVSSSCVGPGQLPAFGFDLQHHSGLQCLGHHHVVQHGVHQRAEGNDQFTAW